MMKRKTNNKLLTYSLLSSAFLATHQDADAQAFIYTDPTPDIILDVDYTVNYQEAFLDVNLDGINDFRVFASYFYNAFCDCGGWSLGVDPLGGAQVGQFISLDYCPGGYGYPASTASAAMLKVASESTTIDPTFGWVGIKRKIVDVTFDSGYGAVCSNGFIVPPLNVMHYIPFRISNSSGSWNYGWMRYGRMSLGLFRIFDYTLNAIPDAPLLTGEGIGSGTPCDAPTGLSSVLTSSVSADLSWSPVSMADKYLLTGTLVGSGVTYSKVSTSSSVSAMPLVPGTYTWQVRTRCLDGTVSPFSATSSFTVPSPMSSTEEASTSSLRVTADDQMLTADFSSRVWGNAVLSLHDLSGTLLDSRQIKVADGDYQVKMDCSDIAPGVYIVSLRSADEITAEKVVIR